MALCDSDFLHLAVNCLCLVHVGRQAFGLSALLSEMVELPVCAAAWPFGTKCWTFRQASDGSRPANISFIMALFQSRAGTSSAFLCSNTLRYLQHMRGQRGSFPASV